MVHVQELASSKQGLRHLMLMVDLAKRAQGNHVSTDWFYQDAGGTTRDEARLTGDFESLQRREWLWFERSVAGIDEVVLTQTGLDVIEEFEDLGSSPQKRAMAARDHMLRWLYDCYLEGNPSPVIDRFFDTDLASFYGTAFTEADLERAGDWLHSEELIAGTKSWGGPIPRPNITPKGIRVVEGGASVNAQNSNGGTTVHNNINIKGSHSLNVAAGSSNVTQSNTVTIEQRKQTNEFIGSTRDLLPALGLSNEQQEAVAEIIDELEAETASATPRQNKMKELAGQVVEIVVTGTTTGMVNALVAMGTSVLTSLG